MTESTEYLRRADIALQYGIPVATLAYWHARNEGPPSALVGRRRLYRRDDLERWLDSHWSTETGRERA